MFFRTETGSLYEVDKSSNMIRRVSGKYPGTPRLGTDGDWRPYRMLCHLKVGQEAMIVWGDNVAPIDPTVRVLAKTTMTSPIVEIME